MGKTILETLHSATKVFWKKDIESPRIEAELLLGHILNLKRTGLYLNSQQVLSPEEEGTLERLINERLSGKPLQYILGEVEFYGLKLKIDHRALIPRPETEILVSKVLEHFKKINKESGFLKFVDVGTGSGNIAIALACNLENSFVYATDLSSDALSLARENAETNRVEKRIEFLYGDLLNPLQGRNLEGKIDAIVSNPPYVRKEEKELLQKEVRDYEPEIALFAEVRIYQRIIKQSSVFLKRGEGVIVLETGYNQAQKVRNILEVKGDYASFEIIKDLAGIERVVSSIKR